MIGTREPDVRRARTASMPFMSGISTSMVTTSGFSCSTRARARRPSDAVPTTSTRGSAARASVTSRRTTTESSTTRTRIAVIEASGLWGSGRVDRGCRVRTGPVWGRQAGADGSGSDGERGDAGA